ncbi:MAG: serine--tRNA ligase, partial [Flavobacterium sp.]
MLQIAVIRENPERIITALQRKHFDARAIVREIVELDEKRRSSQAALDNVLAESNKLSKDIGMLMKN